jgi:hypothetical protein
MNTPNFFIFRIDINKMSLGQTVRGNYFPAAQENIPGILTTSGLNKPIPSGVKTRIVGAQNGSQNASGFHYFAIPQGNYAIKPYSAYLRADVTITGAGTETWGFQGRVHSAASLINQMVINASSTQADIRQNYHEYFETLALHAATKDYVEGDLAVMCDAQFGSSSTLHAYGETVSVCIPLLSEVVFCNNKAFPMYLMNQPLQVQINYNALAQAILASAGTVTNFTVANAQICFESVDLEQSFVDSVKMSMMDPAAPKLYQLNATQYLSSRPSVNAVSNINLNVGTNLSSVLGVLWSITSDLTAVNGQQKNYKNSGVAAGSDFRVLLDGSPVSAEQINTVASQYANMNRVLGSLQDTKMSFSYNDTSSAVTTKSNFTTAGFLGGVSATKYDPSEMAMSGSKCDNLNIQAIWNTTTGSADVFLYFVLYSVTILIDAQGNITRAY